MEQIKSQTQFFRGIYEFEDPSGTMLACKVPATGSADLYKGTVVNVRPNQCALFIYKGKVADILYPGSHVLDTDNLPVLTRISNWRLGFQNPFRCEIVFLSGQVFTGRRWGTSSPVFCHVGGLGEVPLRAFGNYSISLSNPQLFYETIFGTKMSVTLSEVEDLVQGHILEQLPSCVTDQESLKHLHQNQDLISKKLEDRLNSVLMSIGLRMRSIQLMSILPSTEVVDAINAKTAMASMKNPQDILMYNAAKSMGQGQGDSLQLLTSLLLGKLLQTNPEKQDSHGVACARCQANILSHFKFCPNCGEEQG